LVDLAKQNAYFSGQTQPADFESIVWDLLKAISMETTNIETYAARVEMLKNLMNHYIDKDFIENLKKIRVEPNLENPFYRSLTPRQKKDYVDSILKELVALIHRSGFDMPIKRVEGVLDEDVIDELMLVE